MGRFLLDDAELDAAELAGPRSMVVAKAVDGQRRYGFDPPAPARDTAHRATLAAAMRELAADLEVMRAVDAEDEEFGPDLCALADDVLNAKETLDPAVATPTGRCC